MRQEAKYMTIRYLHETKHYSIIRMCEKIQVSRAAYYKWRKRPPSKRQLENEEILEKILESYKEQDGILGYRQMTIVLDRRYKRKYNYKRIYRLMSIAGLKSVCRKKRYPYIKSTPEVTAENVLGRDFKAEYPNEKWLTDVTEFKYGSGQKLYLSAILDIFGRNIVSYVIGSSNNNALVFETFDKAVAQHPDATPIFHSDRGFQYTSKVFRAKLDYAGMKQSMSRVGCCIDNGPMEGFWGILKSEMYYLHKFHDYESLKEAIENYIEFYNNRRYQKRLNCMTPMEYIATLAA